MLNLDLKDYIENNILPQYNNFDKGHDLNHIQSVIDTSLKIAKDYDVNMNMVYTIACYHDLGIKEDRKTHHLISAKILSNDHQIKKYFSDQQIKIMIEAIEDHRASASNSPRTIYGKIVADADRQLDFKTILYRTYQYTLKYYPDLTKQQGFERCFNHILDKYGKEGYMKLYLNNPIQLKQLEYIQEMLKQKQEFEKEYYKIMEL